jgi:hypothetical protein
VYDACTAGYPAGCRGGCGHMWHHKELLHIQDRAWTCMDMLLTCSVTHIRYGRRTSKRLTHFLHPKTQGTNTWNSKRMLRSFDIYGKQKCCIYWSETKPSTTRADNLTSMKQNVCYKSICLCHIHSNMMTQDWHGACRHGPSCQRATGWQPTLG